MQINKGCSIEFLSTWTIFAVNIKDILGVLD